MNNPQEPLLSAIIDSFLALPGWELFATLLGIAYIVLAARESIWCWPAAFTSTLIYTILFWEGQLPMQTLLHAYYMGMAVYGWSLWRQRSRKTENLVISSRPARFHLWFIAFGVALSLTIAYFLEQYIDTRQPYLDAFVTVFAVMNTVLMARKVLETWLYWLVIDSAAIVLYWQTGFYVIIIMFSVYLVLAVIGYINWRKLLHAQNAQPQPI